jgi:hypothetical protein
MGVCPNVVQMDLAPGRLTSLCSDVFHRGSPTLFVASWSIAQVPGVAGAGAKGDAISQSVGNLEVRRIESLPFLVALSL